MFVGRDHDAVAILCLASTTEVIGPGGVVTQTTGTVMVGSAIGSTLPNGETGWRLGSGQRILSRGVGLEAHGFLMALRTSVHRAMAERDPQHWDASPRPQVVSA
jgi:hypothetical protein